MFISGTNIFWYQWSIPVSARVNPDDILHVETGGDKRLTDIVGGDYYRDMEDYSSEL